MEFNLKGKIGYEGSRNISSAGDNDNTDGQSPEERPSKDCRFRGMHEGMKMNATWEVP